MDAKRTDIAVRLRQVKRTFGGTVALHDVSLDIPRGEILSLVGPSGCGKSTLLRIIAGVERIDAGQIVIDGRTVDGSAFIEPEARGVGFMFQDYALFPHLSVRDNVLFGLKNRTRSDAIEAARDILRRVGIAHLADRFPHALSGGEQQRVALARALAPRPAILLMDEPFSNLDQGLRHHVRGETLSLLRTLGTTAIMVTHDPQEALSAGDRVALMRAGNIVQQGSALDLYDRPNDAYAAEFFCGLNKVPGLCRNGRIETPVGVFAQQEHLGSDGDRILYIRPDGIEISMEAGDLQARIEQRIFMGAIEHVILRVAGLDAPLTAATARRLPDSADVVRFSIVPEKVLIF